jgi:hypothetical protein
VDNDEALRTRANTGLAEGVGFEPTRERNPLPVFKTGAFNHSAILPELNPFIGLPTRPEKAHRQPTSGVERNTGPKRPGPDPSSSSSSVRARCATNGRPLTQRAMASEPWPNRPDMVIASSP